MINLKKSHLVEDSAKVLGHYWPTGGFWAPNVKKLQVLIAKTDKELGRMLRPSLYGLLNFYREIRSGLCQAGRAPQATDMAGRALVDEVGLRIRA